MVWEAKTMSWVYIFIAYLAEILQFFMDEKTHEIHKSLNATKMTNHAVSGFYKMPAQLCMYG